jgi:phosphate transport system substrate-binding protein
MRRSSIGFAVAGILGGFVLFGCGDNPDAAKGGAAGGDKTATNQPVNNGEALTGAGSTFINPIMTQWIDAYKKDGGVAINYQSIGSGGGISGLVNHTVDFAGSDAPMNSQETADAKAPVLHLPVVIGTECIAYNIAGVQSGLHLTGPIISDIFLGNITKWNDPKIASLNPQAKLPDAAISVTHRSEGSGTTYILTDYLSKVSPDWKGKVGTGKSVRWPVGLGGKGNEGVAGLLKTHDNSIGYVELAYAKQNSITYASIQNAAGNFVDPSSESGSAAADGVTIPDDMKVSITNTPNAKGYPITGFTWVIVYQSSPRGADLQKFLKWVLDKGQGMTKDLSYAPIPDSLKDRESKLVDSIK